MKSIRNEYSKLGIDEFYKLNEFSYENPHYNEIKKLITSITIPNEYSILDLCSGNGEITTCLNNENILGCDPYLYKSYEQHTNKKCLTYDFKQIAKGSLSIYHFDVIICSFALHLCPNSLLNNVLYQLSLVSNYLIIITPNKKPDIDLYWEQIYENKFNRVTMKIYKNVLSLY